MVGKGGEVRNGSAESESGLRRVTCCEKIDREGGKQERAARGSDS